MDKNKLNNLLSGKGILITGIRQHSKASEEYIDVEIIQDNNYKWVGSIPFIYRRSGLFLRTEKEITKYLCDIKKYFTKENIEQFKQEELSYWQNTWTDSKVTIPFFTELLKMKWTLSFPQNENPQRRIQAIKEKGYTIVSRRKGRKTERLLLPIPRGAMSDYETISSTLKKQILNVLKATNIYELSSANKHGLLPDHKFSEIRWDEKTKDENPEDMSETEIKDKFQLLDNQRNQQKREVCRKCFQTGKRGKLFGINYFYEGTEDWDFQIEKLGKEAEQGCIGCGWYDIRKWRDSLNELLTNK